MLTHKVKDGECMDSIAARYGFPSGTLLFEHALNARLREMRRDPGVLMPGDEVVIPDRTAGKADVQTGTSFIIEVKAPRRRLRLALRDGDDVAISNQPWTVEGERGQALAAGLTDVEGQLEASLPANVTHVAVYAAGLSFRVAVGFLDPLDKTSLPRLPAIASRLLNLGYDPGNPDEEGSPQFAAALAAFQRDEGLPPTGSADSVTLAKLQEVHGC